MPALYPMMVDPTAFKPGDCVRKWITEWNVTPFVGVVTHIATAANKVWVQWPIEHSSESPETLVKVNPQIFGLPTALKDRGYSSYEKGVSERLYGQIPKAATELSKKALRIAHTFATEVVGKLVNDIVARYEEGLSDVQAYNRVYPKYANICSDYIIQSSVRRVYAEQKESGTILGPGNPDGTGPIMNPVGPGVGRGMGLGPWGPGLGLMRRRRRLPQLLEPKVPGGQPGIPGMPDGTGPMKDDPSCPFYEEE